MSTHHELVRLVDLSPAGPREESWLKSRRSGVEWGSLEDGVGLVFEYI